MDPLSIITFSLAGLRGCIKALVIISKASSFNANVRDAQVRTSLILHSLTTWAVQAGLTSEPPKLSVSLGDAPIVPKILQQIEALFSDINELSTRYGSELQSTGQHLDDLDSDEKTLVPVDERRSWVNRIIQHVYLSRAQPWKRMRWVAIDDEKFTGLLDKAKAYVSELEKFLEQAKQDKMRSQIEMILRQSILDADERLSGIIGEEYKDPHRHNSIAAAARFKQMRLAAGITDGVVAFPATPQSSSEVRSPTHLAAFSHRQGSRLQLRLLTLSRRAQFQPVRTLAQYDGRTVLLEWKHVTNINDQLIAQRVDQVAALLHNLGPSLHSLQCRGYVKDIRSSRYGFVFDLPHAQYHVLRRTMSLDHGNANNAHASDAVVKSLREIFDIHTSPSLNTRLSIALCVLETLLNLHTAGWLHKELHSASVILVRKRDTAGDYDPDLSSYTTYIAGYVSSRADSPGELTETLQSEGEANLYRHPSLLSDTRQPFRKSFDIFSVGCTLLEIGLWSPLRRVLEGRQRPEDEVPRPLVRHMSDPNVQPVSSLLDEKIFEAPEAAPPLDLMALKQQLLSVHLPSHKDLDVSNTSLTISPRGTIMSNLQSVMGKKYTSIVEDLLAVSASVKSSPENEDGNILELEMRARNVVQSIADAI